MNQPRDPPPYTEGPEGVPDNDSPRHSLRSSDDAPPIGKRHTFARSPGVFDSQPGSHHRLTVPPRRNHYIELASNNPYRRLVSATFPSPGQSLDGAHDYNHEARITSTTWSTISKVSRRIFSDSSETSRVYASARYNHAYNELATRYGLRQLTIPSQDVMKDRMSAKAAPQHSRRQGWFARKFLPRPSATYTYKARTTFQPLSRKKSFSSRSSSFSDDGRRNILEGKVLEETCKLGGVGILMLPKDYCLETPTLPACLSASASYLLNHGVNASGLFRISGQTSIVNALYDYYAHQFGHAGSPTKVQATVQSGQLPLHIEYNLADIATLFKKILKGLPGGLLGSIEIFEAVSQTLLHLDAIPSLADQEFKTLKAKMIALSLLSITSLERFNLIQAVVGLFAYLADQAEDSHARAKGDSKGPVQDAPPTGLMGYQALGVCLGPLLTGDLIEDVGSLHSTEEGAPKISSESGKAKKKSASSKLENSPDLNALVGRANLSASVMQHLLMSWRDVVQQLRIATASEAAIRNSVVQQSSITPHFATARNAIRVTDEELLFLKMMRGGEVPLDYPFDVMVKRKVTAKSKSSMPQLVHESPKEQASQRDWFHDSHVASEQQAKAEQEEGESDKPAMILAVVPAIASALTRTSPSAGHVMEGGASYRNSIASLNEMIAGQILPPREELAGPSSPPSSIYDSPSSPYYTPTRGPRSSRKSSSADQSNSSDQLEPVTNDGVSSNSRPEATVPPRRGLPPPPVEPPPVPAIGYKPGQSSQASRVPSGLAKSSMSRRSASGSRTASINAAVNGLSGEVQKKGGHSYRSSRSNSGVGLEIKDSAPKFELPVIPCFETSAMSDLEDPFMQTSSPSTPKKRESLIPKPASSGIRAMDPPKKSPASYKRKSVFNIVRKDSPGPSKIAVPVVTRDPQYGCVRSRGKPQRSRAASDALQPLSAQSLNSMTLRDLQALDSFPIHIDSSSHHRSASDGGPDSQNDQPGSMTRIPSDGAKAPNSTLYAEITRLKRQLEHRDETLVVTRRSLEAATMAKEEGPSPPTGGTTPKRGSWNKGTLSHEVNNMKSQRDSWKQRAEWAEKRLVGVEGQGSRSERRVREV